MRHTAAALVALFVSLLFIIPSTASAQNGATHEYDVEVFGSLGFGKITRYDDDTRFGSGASYGGGLGWRPLRALGVEVEVHGMSGLKEGIKSSVAFSANAAYHFRTRRSAIQPYVLAGLGSLRTIHRRSLATNKEIEYTDSGWGLNIGAGARIFVAPGWSLRPQLNWVECPWLSRENLGVVRASVALGHHWG